MSAGLIAPPFNVRIDKNGYAWWYIDVVSDDGMHGIVVIVFVGAVFSPFYARERRMAPYSGADPREHCAVNVSIYGPHRRWVYSEEPYAACTTTTFTTKSARVERGHHEVQVEFEDLSAPLGLPCKGSVALAATSPPASLGRVDLGDGVHHWWPVHMNARAQVRLESPRACFDGVAYHDCNAGSCPLEQSFSGWSWERRASSRGAEVLYDTQLIDGSEHQRGWLFSHDGQVEKLIRHTRRRFTRSRWGLERATFAERSADVRLVKTYEDTPFYTRSLLTVDNANGERSHAVHERLDLRRFRKQWVQFLAQFRMRRDGAWGPKTLLPQFTRAQNKEE